MNSIWVDKISLLESTFTLKIEKDVVLAEHTNTKTGGITPAMIYPTSVSELTKLVRWLDDNQILYAVLGEMTNVVIASGELDFVVINMSEFNTNVKFNQKSRIIEVGASVPMKKLSRYAQNHNINGLQWMEGIPGTIGAGVYMNAGFLEGQDVAHYLIDATVLEDGKIRTLTNGELQYTYRKSSIQGTNAIVLSARFLVRIGKHWKISLRMLQYHRRRAQHQPLELPSAGTVFIPPFPYHVGAMIPQLKLSKATVGGAQVSTKSPGFIVAKDDSMTGEDYTKLVKLIQQQVNNKFGIQLEPEVRFFGFSNDREHELRH